MTTERVTKAELELQQRTELAPIDVGFLDSEAPEGTGMENLDLQDFAKPKLLLCQANTPHRKKTSDVFMEGLEEGNFFNSVSRVNYGSEIEIIPISVGPPYAVKYDENGKIVDFNVSLDDESLIGYNDDNGKYHAAQSKRQLDYVLLVSSHKMAEAVWTAKGGGRGVAKQLNIACASPITIAGQQFKKPQMFARAFRFTARVQPGENSNYGISLGLPRLVTRREYGIAKKLYELGIKNKDDEADSF